MAHFFEVGHRADAHKDQGGGTGDQGTEVGHRADERAGNQRLSEWLGAQ